MEEDLEQTLRALAKEWDTKAIGLVCSGDSGEFEEGQADGLVRASTDLARILRRLK